MGKYARKAEKEKKEIEKSFVYNCCNSHAIWWGGAHIIHNN